MQCIPPLQLKQLCDALHTDRDPSPNKDTELTPVLQALSCDQETELEQITAIILAAEACSGRLSWLHHIIYVISSLCHILNPYCVAVKRETKTIYNAHGGNWHGNLQYYSYCCRSTVLYFPSTEFPLHTLEKMFALDQEKRTIILKLVSLI